MAFQANWIGVEATLEAFVAACERQSLSIAIDEEYQTYEDLELEMGDTGSAYVYGAKEEDERLSILLEMGSLGDCPGFVVEISRELQRRVVACYAMPIVGLYYLCYADRGRLGRLFYANYMYTPNVVNRGTAFSSEEGAPLDAPDGSGILAATKLIGFDFEHAWDQGPFVTIICPKLVFSECKWYGDLDMEIEGLVKITPGDYEPGIDMTCREKGS